MTRSLAFAALLLSAALLFVATAAAAQTSSSGGANNVLRANGPLPIRNSEPLNTPFLLLTPTSADQVAPRGASRLTISLDIVNNLLTLSDPESGRSYVTDFEEQRFFLDYARGIGDGQEVGVRVPIIARNGGLLDGFIDAYHKTFGFEGGGRGDLPQNRVLFTVTDAAGRSIVSETRSQVGVGDVVFEYRRTVSPFVAASASGSNAGRHLAAAFRALLKVPTGSRRRLNGSGAVDGGVGIALSARPLRRFALHGNLGVVFAGRPRTRNFAARSTQIQFVVAAEYVLDGRTSLIAQTDDNQAPLQTGFSYADRPRRQFTLGLWRQSGAQNRYYVALGENDYAVFAKHAPDFSVSIGLRRTL